MIKLMIYLLKMVIVQFATWSLTKWSINSYHLYLLPGFNGGGATITQPFLVGKRIASNFPRRFSSLTKLRNHVDHRFHDWLVVDLPLWKIWVRQLGWWHSQYMESHKNHVWHHQPVMIFHGPMAWLSEKSSKRGFPEEIRRGVQKWNFERQSQSGFVWKCWVNIPNEIAI